MNLIKAGGLALVGSALVAGVVGAAAKADRLAPMPVRSCSYRALHRGAYSNASYKARNKAIYLWNVSSAHLGYERFNKAIYKHITVIPHPFKPWMWKATVTARPCRDGWSH